MPNWSTGLFAHRRSSPSWLRWALVLLFLHCLSGQAGAEQTAAQITRIERYASEKAARIVLHVSRPVSFHLGEANGKSAAGRLHVDIADASYSGLHSFEMGGLVARLRLLPVDAALRVVMDLSDRGQISAFFLPAPFRVVIDVSRHEEPKAAVPTGRAVNRIALDPGHGGSDPGATGRLGIQEKDIVLDIAHRAAPLLARELGISTLLTRDLDTRVPLEERVARANAFGADLFVSIHCNADPSRSARGAMTFVLDGSHNKSALAVLERENASPSADPSVLARFLEQFGGSAAVAHSTTFAHLLQRATLASLAAGFPEAVDGGVHGAGFYVLAGARMPAVLFEAAFVSNAVEEQRLGTARYRQKLADAIVNAVRAYRAGYSSR